MGWARARLWRRAPFAEGEDPNAAPASYTGEDAARPGSLRRAWQNSLWVYLVGLPFMALALQTVTAGDPAPLEMALRIGLIGLIAAAYVLSAWVTDRSLAFRWVYIGCFVALLLASSLTWGWAFAYYGVSIAIMVAMLIPWRQAWAVIIGWGVALMIIALVSEQPGLPYIALIALVTALSIGGGMEAGRVGERLRRAEQRVAALAVVAERERISRDLHDILGHSLTAISIKSELAARLVESDPSTARQQMGEVTEIARQALADVRATASAIREVRLATELAGATSVLRAAGIEPRLPAALPALSDEVSELFGYVVREAVTNVVRHSEAQSCTVSVTADAVSVADDGIGVVRSDAGSGLNGLAARVAAAGGALEVHAEPGAGTRVTARVSGATTADAAAAKAVSIPVGTPPEPPGSGR